ncbi:MAG: WG repeat-containing protein [Clostridium sp.]
MDSTGKIVIDAVFEEAYEFTDGIARVEIGKRIGYIDKLGEYLWKLQS